MTYYRERVKTVNDYTVRICDILESFSVPVINQSNPFEFLSIDQVIEKGMDSFFNFDFPWYTDKEDQSLKDFKSLFLHANYLESIGQENFTQFQLVMQSKLMEIMPEYEELYKTIKMDYDPLINRYYEISVEEDGNGEANSTGTSNTTGTSNEDLQQDTQDVFSRNPEVSVTDNNFASEMNRGQRKNVNSINTSADGNTSTQSTSTYNNNKKEIKKGFEGESQSENIIKYRKAILNLNKMICDELHKVCFLHYYGGVYYRNENII